MKLAVPGFLSTTVVIVFLFIATITTTSTAAAAAEEAPVIADLSVPEFTSSPFLNDSPGAAEILDLAASTPELRTLMVLEQGQKVVDYVRDVVDPTVPYQVFSTTKSWMSLTMGMLVQDGVLNVEETLGEIFPDETLWQNMTDVEFRKAVTVQELLTMNSGMESPLGPGGGEEEEEEEEELEEVEQKAAEEEEEEEMAQEWWGDGGTLGGATLFQALQEPYIKGDKTFCYLGANNILSYIVPQRTDYKTPREYMAAKVFPYLGISDSSIDWWKNEDGLEYSYHGLLLTHEQMAKLGQLYLQGGKSNTTYQLINEEWVTRSMSLQGGNFFYGYLWWVYLGAAMERPDLGTVSCAQGLGGQDICVSPLTNRVVVQQRDLLDEYDPNGDRKMMPMAMTPTLVFDPNRKGALDSEEDGTISEAAAGAAAEEEVSNPLADVISAASALQQYVAGASSIIVCITTSLTLLVGII